MFEKTISLKAGLLLSYILVSILTVAHGVETEKKNEKEIPLSIRRIHESSVAEFNEAKYGVLLCMYNAKRKALSATHDEIEFRATVVRSLKGGWKIGHRLLCRQIIDRGGEYRTEDGDLVFLFSNGADKENVIHVHTGEIPSYEEDLLKLLLESVGGRDATP